MKTSFINQIIEQHPKLESTIATAAGLLNYGFQPSTAHRSIEEDLTCLAQRGEFPLGKVRSTTEAIMQEILGGDKP